MKPTSDPMHARRQRRVGGEEACPAAAPAGRRACLATTRRKTRTAGPAGTPGRRSAGPLRPRCRRSRRSGSSRMSTAPLPADRSARSRWVDVRVEPLPAEIESGANALLHRRRGGQVAVAPAAPAARGRCRRCGIPRNRTGSSLLRVGVRTEAEPRVQVQRCGCVRRGCGGRPRRTRAARTRSVVRRAVVLCAAAADRSRDRRRIRWSSAALPRRRSMTSRGARVAVRDRRDLDAPEQAERAQAAAALGERRETERLAFLDLQLPLDDAGVRAQVAGDEDVLDDGLRPFDDLERDVGARAFRRRHRR